MQLPKDGISLNLFSLPFISSIDTTFTVVYDRKSELEAFTLYRSLSQLGEKLVRVTNLYDFLFNEKPYASVNNIVAFLNDINDVMPFLDEVWSLGGKAFLVTCNVDLKKSKGDVEVISRKGELCEIETSLSVVKEVANMTKNKRSEDLLKELNSLNTLTDWLKSKLQEIKFDGVVVLSPILLPARGFMQRYLGREIKSHEDSLEGYSDYTFITTGGDLITVRKLEFELRSKGKKVKEYIFDVDPLLAPIYLSLLTYLFKQSERVL